MLLEFQDSYYQDSYYSFIIADIQEQLLFVFMYSGTQSVLHLAAGPVRFHLLDNNVEKMLAANTGLRTQVHEHALGSYSELYRTAVRSAMPNQTSVECRTAAL